MAIRVAQIRSRGRRNNPTERDCEIAVEIVAPLLTAVTTLREERDAAVAEVARLTHALKKRWTWTQYEYAVEHGHLPPIGNPFDELGPL